MNAFCIELLSENVNKFNNRNIKNHLKQTIMKKSYLFLILLASFFSVNTAFAQANVLSTGISIQGIARDNNNSALANIAALSLQFKIYYLNVNSAEVDIRNQSATVATDNFGVFSYVLSIDRNLFTQISNNEAYLKVMSGSTVFSNEKLQTVPYAIQAQNGVPTGTIMAYIGAAAPEGWLLCNGASFADTATNAKLKELLGSLITPDLTARYLRGTGTSNGRGGITLKGTQDDEFRPHNHGVNLNTTTTGEHNHDVSGDSKIMRRDGKHWVVAGSVSGNTWSRPENEPRDNRINVFDNDQMANRGNHQHQVIGNTADAGNATANETRPYSYGVNYIIKI